MKRIYLCKFAKFVLTAYRKAISAIRNIKFLLWFVWVTSCFNSGTIQWSPLKNLRVGKSLLNGQEARDFPDFSGILLFGNFLKGPSNIHLFKVNNGNTRIMCQICWELTLKKLGWRYWPRSVVFIVVNFEHIPHIVLAVPLLALKK